MFERLLQLDKKNERLFVAHHHQENFRHTLFGGQVLAQALMAAGRTTDRPCHSLHAYFLRPGKTSSPVEYHVDFLRDGKSVSTRSVAALQDGEVIYTMQCSFHHPENGYEHQLFSPTCALSPTSVEEHLSDADRQRLAKTGELIGTTPIEMLPCQADVFNASDYPARAQAQFWMRSRHPLPNDPLMHACAAAFASDIGLLATAIMPQGISLFGGEITPASMDHSIWFHTPIRFDHWHLYCTDSPWSANARGFSRGSLYDEDFAIKASTAQEGIIRPVSN